jgi:ribonuclease HI
MKATVYTDGSSRGNPGKGGWAAIILTDEEVIELGGREDMTTNNRMELTGTIYGLRAIGVQVLDVLHDDPHMQSLTKSHTVTSVEVCTDSEYVKKGMTEWIKGWVAKGWKTSTKKDVLNKDLWEALLHEETRLKDSGVTVTWKYVRGHAGIPGNERADTIATQCADNASHLQLYRGERSAYPYF